MTVVKSIIFLQQSCFDILTLFVSTNFITNGCSLAPIILIESVKMHFLILQLSKYDCMWKFWLLWNCIHYNAVDAYNSGIVLKLCQKMWQNSKILQLFKNVKNWHLSVLCQLHQLPLKMFLTRTNVWQLLQPLSKPVFDSTVKTFVKKIFLAVVGAYGLF